jgi:hypothetical protein
VRVRWVGRVQSLRAYLKPYESLDQTWDSDSNGNDWAALSLGMHLGVVGWIGAHVLRLLVLPVTFTARVAGVLPVEVEAADDEGTVRRWRVHGFREALSLQEQVVNRLEEGLALPQVVR